MKRQIHLKPEDLKESDKLGLTYNLGQAHKKMLLKQSGIMKKFGLTARQSLIIAYLSTPIRKMWSPRRRWKNICTSQTPPLR